MRLDSVATLALTLLALEACAVPEGVKGAMNDTFGDVGAAFSNDAEAREAAVVIEDPLAYEPSWEHIDYEEWDEAGEALVAACEGAQLQLRNLQSELDGSVIFGRVQNEVDAMLGQSDAELSRSQAERDVLASLDPEERERFKAFVTGQERVLEQLILSIAGEIRFYDKLFEGIRDFDDVKGDKDGLEGFLHGASVVNDMLDQTGELQRLQVACREHAEKLEQRMEEWRKVAEEV
ncbi:MAG: hypothetical protein AAF682_14920 [Planctomycetota bacterium]